MAKTSQSRNVIFVLLGVAALVLKRHYFGPFVEIVHSYGGNVSASFAVYFVVRISSSGWRSGMLLTVGIALLVVTKFQDLIRRAAPHMRELRFPLLATAHDYEFIFETRRDA